MADSAINHSGQGRPPQISNLIAVFGQIYYYRQNIHFSNPEYQKLTFTLLAVHELTIKNTSWNLCCFKRISTQGSSPCSTRTLSYATCSDTLSRLPSTDIFRFLSLRTTDIWEIWDSVLSLSSASYLHFLTFSIKTLMVETVSYYQATRSQMIGILDILSLRLISRNSSSQSYPFAYAVFSSYIKLFSSFWAFFLGESGILLRYSGHFQWKTCASFTIASTAIFWLQMLAYTGPALQSPPETWTPKKNTLLVIYRKASVSSQQASVSGVSSKTQNLNPPSFSFSFPKISRTISFRTGFLHFQILKCRPWYFSGIDVTSTTTIRSSQVIYFITSRAPMKLTNRYSWGSQVDCSSPQVIQIEAERGSLPEKQADITVQTPSMLSMWPYHFLSSQTLTQESLWKLWSPWATKMILCWCYDCIGERDICMQFNVPVFIIHCWILLLQLSNCLTTRVQLSILLSNEKQLRLLLFKKKLASLKYLCRIDLCFKNLNPNNRYRQLPKDSMLLIDIIMVFAPVLAYYEQFKMIRETKDIGSFSTDVCAILIISNITRIFFWFAEGFGTPLLLQSLFMIFAQILLLKACIEAINYRRSTDKLPSQFDLSKFWRWSHFEHYLRFIVGLTAVLALITAVFTGLFQSRLYGNLVGYVALSIEAALGLPQLIKNHRSKSVEGLSYVLIFSWFAADFFKTIYFISGKQPLPFIMCGGIQLFVDVLIISQIKMYQAPKKSSGASGSNVSLQDTNPEFKSFRVQN